MLASWKDVTVIVQSIVTVVAIFIGGVWTYYGVIRHRLDNPRLQLAQRISHVRLSDTQNMLIVDETLTNSGSVLLDLKHGGVYAIQIVPLPPKAKSLIETHQQPLDSDKARKSDVWYVLADREKTWDEQNNLIIEPGETDQLHDEFVIPANVQVVTVVSYIYNPEKEHQAWRAEDVYDLRSAERQISTSPQRTVPKK